MSQRKTSKENLNLKSHNDNVNRKKKKKKGKTEFLEEKELILKF